MNQPISESDRSLAILAHLSGLAGYIIPFGGAVVPLCLMLFIKGQPQVTQLAKQALFLNIAMFILAGILFAQLRADEIRFKGITKPDITIEQCQTADEKISDCLADSPCNGSRRNYHF